MTTYLGNNRNLLWKNVVFSLAYVVPKITEGEELITSIGAIVMFALYSLAVFQNSLKKILLATKMSPYIRCFTLI